jgi:hypothetical protein
VHKKGGIVMHAISWWETHIKYRITLGKFEGMTVIRCLHNPFSLLIKILLYILLFFVVFDIYYRETFADSVARILLVYSWFLIPIGILCFVLECYARKTIMTFLETAVDARLKNA